MRRFTVLDCPQRSAEWLAARSGRLTASRAADMLARTQKGEAAAGRRHLKTQLVLERLTGKVQESGYQNQAMRDGIEREPDALLLYEAMTGQIVERTGFISHTELLAGASLDGHIGDFEGLVEAKCPMATTHLDAIRTGKVPGDYLKQILHQLWITGAQWCDWLSYQPDFPEHLQAKLVRVYADPQAIQEYEREARAFLTEVDQELAALATMTNLRGTLSAMAS